MRERRGRDSHISLVSVCHLEQENAYLYVCGDADNMARDVQSALRKVLMSHSGKYQTELQAETYLTELKQRQRFVLDIWS